MWISVYISSECLLTEIVYLLLIYLSLRVLEFSVKVLDVFYGPPGIYCNRPKLVFTAQCRNGSAVLGNHNFVCLSIRPSHACFVTKRKNILPIF